jgi:hypothetical protein
MRLVSWLTELGKDDGALAGGKGANLGELLRARLPVPPGFVVTTAAYRDFVAANSLQPEIERLAQAAAPEDMTAVTSAANAIGALFAQAILPPEVATAIREAYSTLREPPVAVRSSATAEDLPGASFAGQMETYLNIRGEEALLSAVRRCWASLWTARAISYRAKQVIAPHAVSLAVVVQELLPADAAGVLFTANPVNGRRDQMVILAGAATMTSDRAKPECGPGQVERLVRPGSRLKLAQSLNESDPNRYALGTGSYSSGIALLLKNARKTAVASAEVSTSECSTFTSSLGCILHRTVTGSPPPSVFLLSTKWKIVSSSKCLPR